jgi:diguanylate cyclase (GGDEF)-like protein
MEDVEPAGRAHSELKGRNELNDFQIRNIEIMTRLLVNDIVDDDIIDKLRESELDYFNLVGKLMLLEEKINIDEKTRLLKFNDDYLVEIIKTASRILEGSRNYDHYTLCLIRFDIDDFSNFNNEYGHTLGDEVLVKFASLIKEHSRPTDYVIRFGGEEFDVILPSTGREGAVNYLEKIYQKIGDLYVEHEGKKLHVTASAGLSVYSVDLNGMKMIMDDEIVDTFHAIQDQADNALYDAKFSGKNQFRVFDSHKRDEYKKIRKEYVKH